MKDILKKNIKIIVPAVIILLIVVIIALTAGKPTAKKIIGTWTNPETNYNEFNNTLMEKTLTINQDGSYVERTVITPMNGQTNKTNTEIGTWRIQGRNVILQEFNSLGQSVGSTSWKYSSGKIKNGGWTLTLIGK